MYKDDFIYNIGRRIASLRKTRGVSQEELAARFRRSENKYTQENSSKFRCQLIGNS